MAKNVALGEPLRVRVLCCLTFVVKVKSKVRSLWGSYPILLSPPLVVFVGLVLLEPWPSLLSLPRRRGVSGWGPCGWEAGIFP